MENEYHFFPAETEDTPEVNDTLPTENNAAEEVSVGAGQPATEPTTVTVEAQPEAVPESSLLSRVEQAYYSLQAKLTDSQRTLQENRANIAVLRSRIRALAADSQPNIYEDENELHNSKVLVQHDSCSTLISHAEQIREHIYNNSDHAASLLAPLKASVDLLELRVQHVRALEQLLENVKMGLALQERLLEVNLVIEALASKLEVA
jgi:hypothetical protein